MRAGGGAGRCSSRGEAALCGAGTGVDVEVHLCYANRTRASTKGHKWHVHTGPFAALPRPGGGFTCNTTSVGSHYDPARPPKESAHYSCNPAVPQDCYRGDMSGKLGLVNISSRLTGRDRSGDFTATDLTQRVIVIHAERGGSDMIACGQLLRQSADGVADPCSAPAPAPAPRPAPPPAPRPAPTPSPTGAGGGKPSSPGAAACGDACDSTCQPCMGVQDAIKNSDAAVFSLLSECTVKTIAGDVTAPVDDQRQCLTEMAEFGMLQPLLKMLTCCVHDANTATDGCEVGADGKGCILSTSSSKKFPEVLDSTSDRFGKSNTCEKMFLDSEAKKLHTCGQATSILENPTDLEDGAAHGISCIAEMNWLTGATHRSMQLGLPCDKLGDKLCFGGKANSKCTLPTMNCLLQSEVFSNMTRECSTNAFPSEPPPTVSFPEDKVTSSSSYLPLPNRLPTFLLETYGLFDYDP